MRRLLAIVFVVTLLLTSYFIPVTSVFATEVIWGDNNTSTATNADMELFKKCAVLSMIPDLLSSGINELSIDNADDVDDFVDNIINYINSNAEDFVNVNTWSTLNDFNIAIENKTKEISDWAIENGWYTTNYDGTLHSIFDFGNQYIYKTEYKPNPNFVPIMNRLSRLTTNDPIPDPVPHPDFSFLDDIGYLFVKNCEFVQSTYVPWAYYNSNTPVNLNFNTNKVSYYSPNTYLSHHSTLNEMYYGNLLVFNNILKVNFNTTTLQAEYYGALPFSGALAYSGLTNYSGNTFVYLSKTYGNYNGTMRDYIYFQNTNTIDFLPRTDFTGAGLSTFCNYVYNQFANIDIYVDGEPWVICSTSEPTININVNGMELYGGTDKPVTYYYPNGTQIDYQKLYDVIKYAIQNNTPISNQTIYQGDTYYYNNSSYSPTIYNYYSDDDEDENDIINDLLTLAIVPEFDTALLEPIETPILNGEKIMFTGVQAFPDEILFVIGAAFVLILFGAMINRLIE